MSKTCVAVNAKTGVQCGQPLGHSTSQHRNGLRTLSPWDDDECTQESLLELSKLLGDSDLWTKAVEMVAPKAPALVENKSGIRKLQFTLTISKGNFIFGSQFPLDKLAIQGEMRNIPEAEVDLYYSKGAETEAYLERVLGLKCKLSVEDKTNEG